jgi:hypothetical protein
MNEKTPTTNWSIPVDTILDEAVELALEMSWCRTKSEFIRSSVRTKLASLGITPQHRIDNQKEGSISD